MLTVENIAFNTPSPVDDLAAVQSYERREFWIRMMKYPVLLLGALLAFFFLVRPLGRSFGSAVAALSRPAENPQLLEAGPAEGSLEAKALSALADPVTLRERVRELASQEPERAGRLLRAWVKEDG